MSRGNLDPCKHRGRGIVCKPLKCMCIVPCFLFEPKTKEKRTNKEK